MNRIAIVSNNPTQEPCPSFVDSCDYVVRFSQCEGLWSFTGSKVTHWVTRTHCVRSTYVEEAYPRRIKYVKQVASPVVIYGFREENDLRTWMPYVTPEGCRQTVTPINAEPLVYLHPLERPTNGLVLLSWLLENHAHTHSEIVLTGFDFYEINELHAPHWERETIERWIDAGYFRRYDRERDCPC